MGRKSLKRSLIRKGLRHTALSNDLISIRLKCSLICKGLRQQRQLNHLHQTLSETLPDL